jgi:hypothetical protein
MALVDARADPDAPFAPGAQPGQTDDALAPTGVEAEVFADDETRIVHLTGTGAGELTDRLADLPGVARLVPARPSARPVTSNLRIAGIRPLVPPDILVDPDRALPLLRQDLDLALAGGNPWSDRRPLVSPRRICHDARTGTEPGRSPPSAEIVNEV